MDRLRSSSGVVLVHRGRGSRVNEGSLLAFERLSLIKAACRGILRVTCPWVAFSSKGEWEALGIENFRVADVCIALFFSFVSYLKP